MTHRLVLLLCALFIFTQPISFTQNIENSEKELPYVRTGSSIKAYLNGTYIDSWVIGDTVFIDLNSLTPYGYNVMYVKKNNTYYLDYVDHIHEENMIRDLKTVRLTTTGLENLWYKSWVESFDPQVYIYRSTSGGMIHDYGYTSDSATITFNRSIAEDSINTENIRVYINDSFDITNYFTYDFHAPKNRLTITPIDDTVFKFSNYIYPDFNIYFSENLSDTDGNRLTTPISQSFSYVEDHNVEKRVREKNIPLIPATFHLENLYGQSSYVENPDYFTYGNHALIPIESLGTAKWIEEDKDIFVTSNSWSKFPNQLKLVTDNRYEKIISVPFPQIKDSGGQQIINIQNVRSNLIATLSSSIDDSIQINPFIQLKNIKTGKFYSPLVTDHILKAPEKMPSGLYALILSKGLILEDKTELMDSIYYVIYIES